MGKVKVLVVDDSALVRKLLSEILNKDPQIEVVGTAPDPLIAREKIKQLNPDVLTLDVEMPKMDGVTFLEKLMKLRPMPVVMVSTLTEKGAEVTLQALELGAVDFVAKPKVDLAHTLDDYAYELTNKVKHAAKARVKQITHSLAADSNVAPKFSADAVISKQTVSRPFRTTEKIIAIGSSTGGTEAIKVLLMGLPADFPGVVITQHIPEAFSGPFARRMNNNCSMTVYEAADGQHILPGHVYIAPGHSHLLVQRDGARYVCRLNDGPAVNRHKPSVDVLFRSVAQNVGHNGVGVILTGMGDDGARGLKEMRDSGATTIAQDEKTSVVWGMPGEAVKHDAVDEILPLGKISKRLIELIDRVSI
jgi:two-component system chemotaxis response regulator CheB